MEFVKDELKTIKTKHASWYNIRNLREKYALLSYSFCDKVNNFADLRLDVGFTLYSKLFHDYLKLLQSKKEITEIMRDFINYLQYIEGIYKGYVNDEINILLAHIFKHSKVSVEILVGIKKRLLKLHMVPISDAFYNKLLEIDSQRFNELIDLNQLKFHEDKLLNWTGDYFLYNNKCCDIASWFYKINSNKSISYISKGVNSCILRHGWRKDLIVCEFLVYTFEIILKNKWLDKNKLSVYIDRLSNCLFKAFSITDQKYTRDGPLNLLQVLAKYERDLGQLHAEEFIKKLDNLHLLDVVKLRIQNQYISQRIHMKIKDFENFSNVKSEITKLHIDDDFQELGYYEQKFIIFLEICKSKFYKDKDLESTFNEAHKLVELIKTRKPRNNFLTKLDSISQNDYKKLCDEFNLKNNFPLCHNSKNKPSHKIKGTTFSELVKNAKNTKELENLVMKMNSPVNKDLNLYKNWKIVIEKLIIVEGNIGLIIKLFREDFYPHTPISSRIRPHNLLAACLSNIEARDEILEYIFQESGYKGFLEITKAFAVLNDKKTCLALFERFLKFSEFLLY